MRSLLVLIAMAGAFQAGLIARIETTRANLDVDLQDSKTPQAVAHFGRVSGTATIRP